MKHYLQVFAIGAHAPVEIDAEHFAKLKASMKILGNFFDLTENYRVVVEAYKKVERAKHEAELDEILYSQQLYTDSADVRVSLSAPILGYLSSSRYFLDSTDKLLPKFLNDAGVQAFSAFRCDIYDHSPEYRFIEALRNYSQHRALPLHGIVYHHSFENMEKHDTSDIVTSLSLLAEKERLLQDDKFKKSALDGMSEKIDIIKCLRGHMEGLWRQHDFIIKTYSHVAESARSEVDAAIKLFKDSTRENSVGLHAFATDEGEHDVESLPLLVDWDDARRMAVRTCGNLNNLHRRYVTGKIHVDSDNA